MPRHYVEAGERVVGPPRSVFLGWRGSRSRRWGRCRQCVGGALLLWAVPLLLPAVPDLVERLRLGTQLRLMARPAGQGAWALAGRARCPSELNAALPDCR